MNLKSLILFNQKKWARNSYGIDGLRVTSWRSCWWPGTIRFFSSGSYTCTCHFYANFVNKFSFVLSTNMAAMQTTYTVRL